MVKSCEPCQAYQVANTKYTLIPHDVPKYTRHTSSSSRSHLIMGSLRQTQFSSSQFCHGLHINFCCHDSYNVSVSVFRFVLSQMVPSQESFVLRIIGLFSSRVQTTSNSFSCISLWYPLHLVQRDPEKA